MGCHTLLQGIFLTQGSDLHLLLLLHGHTHILWVLCISDGRATGKQGQDWYLIRNEDKAQLNLSYRDVLQFPLGVHGVWSGAWIRIQLSPQRKTTPVFSPGEFHGQRSLADPRGHKALDTTERLISPQLPSYGTGFFTWIVWRSVVTSRCNQS